MYSDKSMEPGGSEAVKLGCICDAERNKHGEGIKPCGDGMLYEPSGSCPLHGFKVVMQLMEKSN